MPNDPQKTSPIAPTMAQAIGFNDRRVQADVRQPKQGMPVKKGHAKGAADPSQGTAKSRVATLESGGARHRVHMPMSMPNMPEVAAGTQANGRIVAPTSAVHRDKTYDPAVERSFDDAPTIADYPAGRQRLRGYTTKG